MKIRFMRKFSFMSQNALSKKKGHLPLSIFPRRAFSIHSYSLHKVPTYAHFVNIPEHIALIFSSHKSIFTNQKSIFPLSPREFRCYNMAMLQEAQTHSCKQ